MCIRFRTEQENHVHLFFLVITYQKMNNIVKIIINLVFM